MIRFLNRKYMLNQFLYYSLFASMFAFVSVYLLDKGFANTTIGTVLSLTSLSSILIQTFLGHLIDRYQQLKLQDVMAGLILLVVLGSVALYFMPNPLGLLLLIIVTFSLTQSNTPLLNSLAFIYTKYGIKINYGFARGIGSLAYALATVVLGYVIEATSSELLPLYYAVNALVLFFAIRSYKINEKELTQPVLSEMTQEKEPVLEKNFFQFVADYKKLVLLMLGVVFLFFTHSIINNFFIQVISPVGGDSGKMGTAIFIGTIVELPAMMNYDRLESKIPVDRLLKISALFFLAKHALTFLAANVFTIYIAQFLQIGAYSIIYPALVDYVNKVVAPEDLVKGQSLLASSIALSGVFGSFIGGILLDAVGVSSTLLLGVITTIIGLLITFLSVEVPNKWSLKSKA